MPEPAEELLNVYDADGRVVGAQPRSAAKTSGLAVGAVNILVLNAGGEVLLQRRPLDKENGGRWDKSVGGHVSAGEDFDSTAVREAGEELFDDGASPRIRLAADEREFEALARSEDLRGTVLIHHVAFQWNLRDVRHPPGSGIRNVLYHLSIYHGRTAVPLEVFRPQKSEIDELRYVTPAALDQLLLGTWPSCGSRRPIASSAGSGPPRPSEAHPAGR
jgi:8-oxo-dGTP pyrophosphatase MutT (NUDIX family)